MENTQEKQKKVVSAFEFAIMGYADPEMAKHYRAKTAKEAYSERVENLKDQATRLKLTTQQH